MNHGQSADFVDRLKSILRKDSANLPLTSEEVQTLARGAAELARYFNAARSEYPDFPIAALSSRLFQVLKKTSGKKHYELARTNIARKAANY